LGSAFAFIIGPVLVTQNNDVWILLLFSAVFALVIGVFSVIFFVEKPAIPPSYSAAQVKVPLIPSIKLLLDINYFILMLGFSIGLAVFAGLSTLICDITEPNGYGSTDSGIFGGVLILVGIVGSGVSGFLGDLTGWHKSILKYGAVLALLSVLSFILSNVRNNFTMLTISCGLIGFNTFALLPIIIELVIEATFPASEVLATGVLYFVGQIFAILMIYGMEYMKNGVNYNGSTWFMFTVLVIGICLMLLYRGDYKRRNKELDAQHFPSKPIETKLAV